MTAKGRIKSIFLFMLGTFLIYYLIDYLYLLFIITYIIFITLFIIFFDADYVH